MGTGWPEKTLLKLLNTKERSNPTVVVGAAINRRREVERLLTSPLRHNCWEPSLRVLPVPMLCNWAQMRLENALKQDPVKPDC